jgi:hypothetical protein
MSDPEMLKQTERPGVVQALQRSSALTEGNRFRVFGIILIVQGPFWVAALLLSQAFGGVTDPTMTTVSMGFFDTPWFFIGLPLSIALSLFSSIAASVSYFELRRIKEGIGMEDLVAVFD